MTRIIDFFVRQEKQTERLRTAFMLVLLTLIAKPAAELTWVLAGFGDGDSRAGVERAFRKQKATGKQASKTSKSAVRQTNAADLHLFGEAGRVTIAPVAETVRDVPKTSLNLVLKGVIAARSMDRALAIINQKGTKAEDEVYGVGDRVLGLAEVREVYPDRVILLRGGRLETLMLQDSEDTISIKAASAGRNVSSKGDGLHWNIDSAYWNKQINDIPALASQVGVDIYRENKVQKGFKLVSSRGNKLLSDLGLKAGDILYEVNGIKLTNAHNGLMAYQKIKGASQVTLKVGRAGRMTTRIYTIK